MPLMHVTRQTALILGLVFIFIGLGQASTPMPTVGADFKPAPTTGFITEAPASPSTVSLSADTLGQQILASVGVSSGTPQPTELPAADRARAQRSFGKLPLSFIENQGQVGDGIAYYIQSPNRSHYFTRDGHALRLTQGQDGDAQAHTIKVELVDAAVERVESLERAEGIVSYFTGPKENWKTAIPTHTKIAYVQSWPGIDLAYDGSNGKLESIYTVAPHADPSQIKLRYSGQDSLTLDDDGNLVYTTSIGEIRESAPIAWQDIDGQRLPVETRFTLLDDSTVSFQVAEYNPEHALIIDPVLVYAGYIGGKTGDLGSGIAVDSVGNAYVTGLTNSTAGDGFTVGPDLTYNGGTDAFVAKVNSTGTALVYAGYIGGIGFEEGRSIAVDSAGNAYVTGGTTSSEASFPVVIGPDLTYNGGPYDAFVVKVNAAGTALVYAGYIGGSSDDNGNDIAVDGAGNAYVTGTTGSTQATFPVTVGPDLTFGGGPLSANVDAFVAKVNPTGAALIYAGYIGGSGRDEGAGIAVDSAGNAYVTGGTTSSEASFPVVIGPDLTYNGGGDIFVAKLNPAGTALVYAGYIGGDDGETNVSGGIAVDSAGNAYVTGSTRSTEASFPVTVGPDLTYNGGPYDAFIVKVNAAGTALVYAGYIGGSSDDNGHDIAVDGAGNAYVTGTTGSTETSFPVLGGPDLTHNGIFDAFVAMVNNAGTALVYVGYIGGSEWDIGESIAVDSARNVYVTGWTESSHATFPDGDGFGALGGPDVGFNGGRDAFVAKISAEPVTSALIFAVNGNLGAEVTLSNPVTVTYQVAGCQNKEMYLVLNAPAMNIIWSYLNANGQWSPLPANLADITPFSAAGPADGGYTLYNGTVPVGNYDLYLGCDFVTNGHLDYTGGTNINGVYDYTLVHVN